jgi:hypothetical protein
MTKHANPSPTSAAGVSGGKTRGKGKISGRSQVLDVAPIHRVRLLLICRRSDLTQERAANEMHLQVALAPRTGALSQPITGWTNGEDRR